VDSASCGEGSSHRPARPSARLFYSAVKLAAEAMFEREGVEIRSEAVQLALYGFF
jgi:hypothetical protein